jgi:iron complex outermembrane receptor protein
LQQSIIMFSLIKYGKYSLLFICTVSSVVLFGQNKTVKLELISPKMNPIAFANLSLQSLDSTIKKSQIADSNGVAILMVDVSKLYKVKVDAIGYQTETRSLKFDKSSYFKILLKEKAGELKEVVVSSTKSLIRQEDDKSIVDPEPLAASSTNALETIEKTPGIFIDADGQIYLNGLSPAGVQINGRDLKMSAADLATLLKSLPPNVIQKIELIRTPSAKYDASGGGGLVNIILKKGVKLGLNGSVNSGFTQGKYGNQFIVLNLNNTNDKLSAYLNTQYNNNDGYSINNTDRFISADTLLQQKARTQSPNNSFYIGYGLSKSLKDKWELSYDGRLSVSNFDNLTNNQSYLKDLLNSNKQFNTTISMVDNKGDNYNINQSFRSKLKLDSASGEWITDFSYNYSNASTNQNYTNQLMESGAIIKGLGNFGNDKNSFIAQSDIKKKWKGLTWEMGIKTSLLLFNNNSKYTKTIAGTTSTDPFRTSNYNFKEQINAAYLQSSKTWGAIVLKFGTRLEQTIMEGHQIVPKDTNFSVNRTDAFPYVYLSRKIMMIAGYELRGFLVYRKTISRPSYDFLNPFPKYIDPFLYEIGNPSLKPQFTSNYEANISVDEKPLFAVGVNETKDIFTSVVYQSVVNKQIAYRTYDNLGKSKEIYFRAIAAIPPGKKYFAVIGAQYNRNIYNGFYENKPFTFDKATVTFFTFQSLKIDTKSVFTINGFWRSNGQQQFYELDNFGQINATLNRQFLNKKLTITLAMNDILFTNNNTFTLHQGSINTNGYRENDTRRWGINMRYNFGFKPKEKKFEMLDTEAAEKN